MTGTNSGATGAAERRGNASGGGGANPAQSDGGGGGMRALQEGGVAAAAAHAHGGVPGHMNVAGAHGKKSTTRPSLARILLSLESNSAKQQVSVRVSAIPELRVDKLNRVPLLPFLRIDPAQSKGPLFIISPCVLTIDHSQD